MEVFVEENEFDKEESFNITRTVLQDPSEAIALTPVPPKTKWFDSPPHVRHYWERPCSLNQNFIILTDSLGRKATSLDIFDQNCTFYSYSGSCLLEALLLMSAGSLTNDNGNLLTEYDGRDFYGNASISDLPFNDYCLECRSRCFKNFKGSICLALGTNNVIKADRKSYQSQNIDNILSLASNVIQKLAPNAKVRFVMPQRPTSYEFVHSDHQRKIFRDFTWSLQGYDTCGPHLNYLKDNKYHSRDGIHIRDDSVSKYWNCVLDDLIRN